MNYCYARSSFILVVQTVAVTWLDSTRVIIVMSVIKGQHLVKISIVTWHVTLQCCDLTYCGDRACDVRAACVGITSLSCL